MTIFGDSSELLKQLNFQTQWIFYGFLALMFLTEGTLGIGWK